MTAAPAHDGIIVLGAPRSGTTLMRRILDAHPDIACPGETNILAACARFLHAETIVEGLDIGVLSGLQFAGFDEESVLAALREFAFGFHREYARRQGKRRWACKSALDVYYLDVIDTLCGANAHFLCVQRHGLDVAVSVKDLCEANEAYLSEIHAYIKRYPRPLEAFCHAWVDATRAMRAFVERHPENAVFVKYEDLVADPAAVTRTIAEFVGVEWTPEWIARAMQGAASVGLGDWKTYGKGVIDAASIGRWRSLSEDTISLMGRICNETLVACGYPPVATREPRSPKEARRRYEMSLKVRRVRKPIATDAR